MGNRGIETDLGRGSASRAVERLTLAFLRQTAERRQYDGQGLGERAPAGLAQPARSLGRIEADVRALDPETPRGSKTARRALPPLLAKLKASDPRRQAADMIADAAERVGASKGMNLQPEPGGAVSEGVSDGGVTTRVKYVARLRIVEIAANGWPRAAISDRRLRGAPRIALPMKYKRGKRQQIKAMALLYALCVEGHDVRRILGAHGWTIDSAYRKRLGEAALLILDDVAEELGLGRADPAKRFDDKPHRS